MFQNEPGGMWKTRLRFPGDVVARKVSLGTKVKTAARTVEAWLSRLAARPEYADVLLAIRAEQVTAFDACALDVAGVRALLAERAAALARQPLAPLIARWAQDRRHGRGGATRAAQYARDVRAVVPADATTDQWTTKALRAWLLAGDVSGATRNRRKAACSSFAQWLIEQEIATQNPAAGITRWPEQARMLWLPNVAAQRLVAALDHDDAIVAACLAIGFGWEWAAAANGRVQDVDLGAGTAHAHGSKNAWRDRVCVLSSAVAWVRPILRRVLADRLPSAPLVRTLTVYGNLHRHEQALRAAGLATEYAGYRFHDHRHTHAILLTLAGEAPQGIWSNLGHKDGTLYYKCYAKFRPTAGQYLTAAGADVPVAVLDAEASSRKRA